MKLNILLQLASAVPMVYAEYTVLGSVIFGRHNDREAKPATYLTPLGAISQYQIGQIFRERYFGLLADGSRDVDSKSTITGLNEDGFYIDGQIYAETTESTVLMSSHYAFLQGLYPPTNLNESDKIEQLLLAQVSNGTELNIPLNGYQYVKSNIQQNATDNFIWTKGDENCPALRKAVEEVKTSELFEKYTNESLEFLQSLHDIPFIQKVFNQSDLTFTNSMNIFDEVLVNTIHNESVSKQFKASLIQEIQYWSDLYQWTISDAKISKDLTIGAQTLISKIAMQLNTTASWGKPFLTYYTGSFNNMYQMASILDLDMADSRFRTMPSYGATLVFELLEEDTNKFVRFLFKNGTDEMTVNFTTYPLFNSTSDVMPFEDFLKNVENVGIDSVPDWCDACGYNSTNTIAMCVPYTELYQDALKLQSQGVNLDSINITREKISRVGAGFIGVGVTLALVMLISVLLYLYKRRFVKKQSILPVMSDDASTVVSSKLMGEE